MDNLDERVRDAVFWYAAGGFDSAAFRLSDEKSHVYAVSVVDVPVHRYPAIIAVMARIVDDYVVIEADNTDRPLIDRLMAAGVPRERIVRAYAGEAIPQRA
jgi:hypothetical protein